MRILVLGGTRFIGRHLVFDLVRAGHTVAVFHRGEHEAGLPSAVQHIHGDRAKLVDYRNEFTIFSPDVVVDLSAMASGDAEVVGQAIDRSIPLVVVSSMDVYRAFSSIYEGNVSDAVPLTENSPLRTEPSPDRHFVPPGWSHEPGVYEKLDVERTYLDRGATICRLPMVYGEHDYRCREGFVLSRLCAGRTRIPFGAGTFLCSRGYAPELARGIRLACEQELPGEIFNLAEQSCATVRLWAEEILRAAGKEGELIRVPEELLPEDLALTGEIAQPLLCDASKASRILGWVHAPWSQCVAKSVSWHLRQPAPGCVDFSADDAALACSLRIEAAEG